MRGLRTTAILFCAVLAACAAKPQCSEKSHAPQGLQRFHDALHELQAGKRASVTVLHLGDSHVARDGLTGILRHRWQEEFGDAGRGLPPGIPYRYYAPDNYEVSMTGEWQVVSSHEKDAQGTFGIQGYRVSSASPQALMTIVRNDGGTFGEVVIEAMGGPQQGGLKISFDGEPPFEVATRTDNQGLVRLALPVRQARRVTVAPRGDGPVTLFGWALLSGKPGIRYDSYGISGVTMEVTERWDAEIVAAQVKTLQPDLIILGYGTNEGFDDALDIVAYGAKFDALLSRLQHLAPQASFAVLGAMDGARKMEVGGNCGEGRGTPPKLDAVRDVQAHAARAHDAFYVDMSQAMGRPCGIDKWAKAVPPLAFADRVHLKPEGAARAGAMLWQALMAPYLKACPAGRKAG